MPEGPDDTRFARYGAAGFDLIGTIIGGAVVGWLLDRHFGTSYLAGTMTIVAVIGGFVRLVQALRHFDEIDRERKP